MTAGNLSAVGLDRTEPGLVLYTLKSGEKGSTLVPGCTMLGCAGAALDSLGDESIRAGFALVHVEVDPRTTSRRLLDMLTGLLSPVLLVAAWVGACVVGIRLQRGMGGAASRLAVRPKKQFTDAIGQEEAKSAFDPLDNVVVVAATNHEDNIDQAMHRPGRFDMLVRLTLPTLPERQKLFDVYISRLAHDGCADTAGLARKTAGMSPADIANTVNKAASTAAQASAPQVTDEHFLGAVETHQLGGEVSAIKELFTQDLRDRLAYHESGHALVGQLNRAKLDRLAQRLLERDAISGDELKGLLGARTDEFADPECRLPRAAAG